MRGASEDLKNVSQDAENASVSFQEASKKISMTAADFDSIRQTVKAFDTQASELNSRLSDNKETISALRTSLRELSKEYKKRCYQRRGIQVQKRCYGIPVTHADRAE